MNRMILAGRRGGGLVDAVKGADMTVGNRQERYNRIKADMERAVKAGDADARAFAQHQLDALVDEWRVGSDQSSEEQTPRSGFDGGIQRPSAAALREREKQARVRQLGDPSPTTLFRWAMESSHARRA